MSGGDELRDAAALVFVDDLDDPVPDPSDLHHLVDVLRLAPGEPVALGDGAGSYRMATIEHPGSTGDGGIGRRARARSASLVVTGPRCSVPPPAYPVTVGFAIPKGDRAEWTVQKLTEIGVDVIVPMLSERTVVRLDGADRSRRVERFRRVAREAAAQSRTLRLPEIREPVRLVDQLASEPTALLAEPGGGPLGSEVRMILVGPEGGWSDAELEAATGTVDLSDHILRAETAAVTAGVLLCALRGGRVVTASAGAGR